MKIQRTPLILVLVALGLSSGIYIQQRLALPPGNRDSDQATFSGNSSNGNALFPFQEKDVVSFTLTRPDLTLTLEKSDSPLPGEPDWQITSPETTPASDGAVAYLLNLLATSSISERFSLTNDNQPQGSTQKRLQEFGLDQPIAKVDLTLTNGTTHQLILGDANFDGSSLYGVKDATPGSPELEILVVDIDLQPAVERPLEEWRYTAELPEPEAEATDIPASAPLESDPLDSAPEEIPPGDLAGEGDSPQPPN